MSHVMPSMAMVMVSVSPASLLQAPEIRKAAQIPSANMVLMILSSVDRVRPVLMHLTSLIE